MSTVRSRKSKGRRLQQKVRDDLRKLFIDKLEDGDIESRPMGCNGTDIILSPLAKKYIPFDIECKNQENLNLLEAITQSENNTQNIDRISLVIFKKNYSKIFCAIKINDLVKLDNEFVINDKLLLEVKVLKIWKHLENDEIFQFKYNNVDYIVILYENILKFLK